MPAFIVSGKSNDKVSISNAAWNFRQLIKNNIQRMIQNLTYFFWNQRFSNLQAVQQTDHVVRTIIKEFPVLI